MQKQPKTFQPVLRSRWRGKEKVKRGNHDFLVREPYNSPRMAKISLGSLDTKTTGSHNGFS